MRLIYLTDTHIQGGRPLNRRDDFLKSLYDKLYEISSICRLFKVDLIIHGGDVFDRPDPDQKSMDLFCWFLKEAGVPLYCVAGNHDLFEQRLGSLDQTALGRLAGTGRVRLLQPGERVYISNSFCSLQLSGQHYYRGIDRRKRAADYMVKKKNCDLAIHVVHGMLLPKAFSERVPCTLISEISATEADFTLGAHAHLGYHENAYQKYFLNPGALSRLTSLEQELVRLPQVLYLELESEPVFRLIPLQSALPGAEVMDIRALKRNNRY